MDYNTGKPDTMKFMDNKTKFSKKKSQALEEIEKLVNTGKSIEGELKRRQGVLQTVKQKIPSGQATIQNLMSNTIQMNEMLIDLMNPQAGGEEEGATNKFELDSLDSISGYLTEIKTTILDRKKQILPGEASQAEQYEKKITDLQTLCQSLRQELSDSLKKVQEHQKLSYDITVEQEKFFAFLNGYDDALQDLNTDLLRDDFIVNGFKQIQDYDKLYSFYQKLKDTSSEYVDEAYVARVNELLKDKGDAELADLMKNYKDNVVFELIKERADTADVSDLLKQYYVYKNCDFKQGKQYTLNQIKTLIDNADTEELSNICTAVNSNNGLPNEVTTAIKEKVSSLINNANTPADLKALYDNIYDDEITDVVSPNFVKEAFKQRVVNLVDADLMQNYQSQQAFDPTLLDKQINQLKQKLSDYQVLDEEFAKIATQKIKAMFNLILEENRFDDIQPGQDANSITNAIDQLKRQLKSTAVQNRLYEGSLTRKAGAFSNLNFISNADKTRAEKFKQEEADYKKVIQTFDAIVNKSYNDLTKNLTDIKAKTMSNIDIQLSGAITNGYDEVLQKSTQALTAIKEDVDRIKQDQMLNELFEGGLQVDDVDNLEKATLQRLNMQLNNALSDANLKIKQISEVFAESLEDLDPIAPLKDFSEASLQALKAGLDGMRNAVKNYNKKQLEEIQKQQQEKEDGTKEIPDEILKDSEVQAQNELVGKLLNKKTIKLSLTGAEDWLKQAEAVTKYKQLIAKKINEKQKKEEEDKKKKEELAKKKKEEREKKQKEKEKKAKEKEENAKKQRAKMTDIANENIAKKAYEDKQEQLNQFKKDNPEPEASIGLCILTFILGVLPLFIYLGSVSSDKKEYDDKIAQHNKEIKEAKATYDAKHQENMQKYNTPNSKRIIKNISPGHSLTSRTNDALQK